MRMLEWLIVGGGVHGTHLSHVLTARCGVPRHRLRVVDPWQEPLARWHACTQNTGMVYLRSSVVHHLALPPFGLKHFAARSWTEGQPFAHPYKRPSSALFAAHVREVVHAHQLRELRLEGRACGLRHCVGTAGYVVETSRGPLHARRVLLAIGATEQPYWPAWAGRLRGSPAPIHHIFDPFFDRKQLPLHGHTLIVGGGITAAQVAMALYRDGAAEITLLRRHAARVHPLDSDPGWMGPKHQTAFQAIPDWDARRAVVNSARHRGAVPPRLHRRLTRIAQRERLTIRQGELVRVSASGKGPLVGTFSDGAEAIAADRIVLATGFARDRPGGSWLTRAVHALGLSCASCGYPIVDASLQWHPGLFVTGPLAELEIGPVARNIVGARQAALRIAAAA